MFDTEAVQQLKRLSEKLPPLQIPRPGKRILQTDASDEYWATALFEEIDGKRNICGYKSGAFKPFIKYQVLDGLQKGSCTNNTFLLGPKYPTCSLWIPLTP